MKTLTKIAGIEFSSCILNASGPNDTTFEELAAIAESMSSAIMMKSCTIEPRQGNDKPRYVRLPLGSIQSMGLPNLGYKEYVRFASELKKYNKPIIASVAGLCTADYIQMVKEFQKSEVDLIEVNLSCPNLEGKPQAAYDFQQTENILSKVFELGEKPIGLKLPPYYDLAQYQQMAELIIRYNVSFITCINSIGNTLIIDPETETPVIKAKSGFGGLCGDYIKPIALANVRYFYELLKDKVSIFGVGGVKSGTDVFEFLLAGADAVQIGTAFEKEGVGSFQRINEELLEIMRRKGYSSVQEVKGKLKYL
ncbi:dihydroorotate oxidase [Candidatus Parcubacteria bacterium]|nr:dihydroorotate oxidase [Candidatus Parcubacteria bacterium]